MNNSEKILLKRCGYSCTVTRSSKTGKRRLIVKNVETGKTKSTYISNNTNLDLRNLLMEKPNVFDDSVKRELSKMHATSEDVDQTMTDMKELLDFCEYEYDPKIVQNVVEDAFENKRYIAALFKQSPYYAGNGRVIVPSKWRREVNYDAMRNFLYEYGFNPYRETRNSMGYEYSLITEVVRRNSQSLPYVNDAIADVFHELGYKCTVGQKLSRVINTICTENGYNEKTGYNRDFAIFADGCNPMEMERTTVISWNPYDFFTMSFGNTWSSCMSIDKNDKRKLGTTYHGESSGGVMSYAMDGTTFIVYTLKQDVTYKDWLNGDGKINRNLFHISHDWRTLVQGRVYPQSCDGGTDLYRIFREFIQNMVAECSGMVNLWTVKIGNSATTRRTITKGKHYPDYEHFSDCNVSIHHTIRNTSLREIDPVVIGSEDTPCLKCGNIHEFSAAVLCDDCFHHYVKYICPHCGCVHRYNAEFESEDDYIVYTYDGEMGCHNCVFMCRAHNQKEFVDDEYCDMDPQMIRFCHRAVTEGLVKKCDDCHTWDLAALLIQHNGKLLCIGCAAKLADYYMTTTSRNIDHIIQLFSKYCDTSQMVQHSDYYRGCIIRIANRDILVTSANINTQSSVYLDVAHVYRHTEWNFDKFARYIDCANMANRLYRSYGWSSRYTVDQTEIDELMVA